MARCAECRIVTLEEDCRNEAAVTMFCDAQQTPIGLLGDCIGDALRQVGVRQNLILATALRHEAGVTGSMGYEIKEAEQALQEAARRVCEAWERIDGRSDR